jgi:hypothetical protein
VRVNGFWREERPAAVASFISRVRVTRQHDAMVMYMNCAVYLDERRQETAFYARSPEKGLRRPRKGRKGRAGGRSSACGCLACKQPFNGVSGVGEALLGEVSGCLLASGATGGSRLARPLRGLAKAW